MQLVLFGSAMQCTRLPDCRAYSDWLSECVKQNETRLSSAFKSAIECGHAKQQLGLDSAHWLSRDNVRSLAIAWLHHT